MGNIVAEFFSWYFFEMTLGVLKAWKNFLWFNLNYFSLPVLLRTLFSHWHKYYSPYGKGFDPWRYLESFVFNVTSRFIGAVLRIFLIIIGIVLEIIILIGGFLVLTIWLVLPVVLAGGILLGLGLLFY